MSADLARYGLSAPVNVTWEITLKCNLQCRHCLSDAGKAMKEELDFDQWRLLIEQLAAIKVFQVNIGGGEPFILDGFPDLLHLAHQNQVVTCVSTNGLLIDNSLARELARLEMLYLQVSLDGATAEVNDAIRGEGAYDKILQAAERSRPSWSQIQPEHGADPHELSPVGRTEEACRRLRRRAEGVAV